ncbi:MAG: response regulator transcription factor [Clostridia bacterium]|nr:response regulator transcription factor [Clostridia bacterium]
MIRIAIVEDEDEAEFALKKNLKEWAEKRNVSFDTIRFSSAEDFLEKYTPAYDVVFMDIELGGMDGMRAAKKLREFDENVVLIFVTNMKKYVVHGYEVGALNYIVKPINFFSFAMTMDRCLRSLERRASDTVHIKLSNGMKAVQSSDILYIDVMKHDLTFHLLGETVQSYGSLTEWERKLAPYHFVRGNASALINLRRIKMVVDDRVYIGDMVLYLSRSKKKEFLAKMMEYYGERL